MPDTDSTGAFDGVLSLEQWADRWKISYKSAQRLAERGVVKAFSIVAKRGKFVRLSDVQAVERKYRGDHELMRRVDAGAALAERDRQRQLWDEFAAQVSPIDPLHRALELAYANEIATNPNFEDAEAFLAARRLEYKGVIESWNKKQQAENAAPELVRMVESRPGAETARDPAPELVAMCGSEKHQGRAR